jgi:hypothetical protein
LTRLSATLTGIACGFPPSFLVDLIIVGLSGNKTWPLPSRSFPVHHKQTSIYSTSYGITYEASKAPLNEVPNTTLNYSWCAATRTGPRRMYSFIIIPLSFHLSFCHLILSSLLSACLSFFVSLFLSSFLSCTSLGTWTCRPVTLCC